MTDSSPELKYWVAFSCIQRVGTARAALIEGYFGSMERAWKASASELAAAGSDRGTVTSIVETRPKISPDNEIKMLAKAGVKAFAWNDPGYPSRLKEVDDRPPVLYVRGELLPEDDWAIAVVGTRRASPYGRQAAEHFSTILANQKITVVSRSGSRIDAVAHRAVLTARPARSPCWRAA